MSLETENMEMIGRGLPPSPIRHRVIRRAYRLAQVSWRKVVGKISPIKVEILVVLAFAVLPGLIGSLVSFFSDPVGRYDYGYSIYLLSITWIPRMLAVAYIAGRSGVRMERLGVVRPNPGVDVLGAGATLAMLLAVRWLVGVGMRKGMPAAYWYLIHEANSHYSGGRAALETNGTWVLAGCYFLLVGFNEEFLYRGYLMTRLRDLSGSKWKALVISSVLFGLTHIYQGYWGTLLAFVFAMVLGFVMLNVRRLYVVALAHGAFDLVISAGMRF